MFRPTPMRRVNILVLDRHVDAVTRALGAAGVLHLSDPVLQSPGGLLTAAGTAPDKRVLDDILSRLDRIAARLPQPAPLVRPGAQRSESAAELDRRLIPVEKESEEAASALAALDSEASGLRAELALLRAFPVRDVPIEPLRDLRRFHPLFGRLPTAACVRLRAAWSAKAPIYQHSAPTGSREGSVVFVVAPRKHRFSIETDLNAMGFKKLDIPAHWRLTADEEARRLSDRLAEVEAAAAAGRARLEVLARRHAAFLAEARAMVEEGREVAGARERFAAASRVYCITGWLPAARLDGVARLVADATGGAGMVEALEPERDRAVAAGREQVPVKFAGSRRLRPFQALVATYGLPAYNELDPTVFVACTFVLMFGIMFGDAGHGLVLALAGLGLLRARRPALRGIRSAGYLLIPCGLSAIVFGLAYGSLFGSEHILPALWLNPMERATTLFGFTVGVGIVSVSVALAMNIYNKFRTGRWFEAVVDKFGLVGALFYWGVLLLAVKSALTGGLTGGQVALVAGLPLAVLFLHGPLHALAHGEKRLFHGGPAVFLLGSAIEVLETVSVFLGSTVSFIRVGAFALSHAALCLATYAVADIVRPAPAGWLYSGVVLVVGNIAVIFMEAMVAGIQGVRLQYYELFSKYFAGDGVPYRPFRTISCADEKED